MVLLGFRKFSNPSLCILFFFFLLLLLLFLNRFIMTRIHKGQGHFFSEFSTPAIGPMADIRITHLCIYKCSFHSCRNKIFQLVICDIFLICTPKIAQWGGSNEYPQVTFLSQNKKRNNDYPCNPHFCLYKMGNNGVLITWTCWRNGKASARALICKDKSCYS